MCLLQVWEQNLWADLEQRQRSLCGPHLQRTVWHSGERRILQRLWHHTVKTLTAVGQKKKKKSNGTLGIYSQFHKRATKPFVFAFFSCDGFVILDSVGTCKFKGVFHLFIINNLSILFIIKTDEILFHLT